MLKILASLLTLKRVNASIFFRSQAICNCPLWLILFTWHVMVESGGGEWFVLTDLYDVFVRNHLTTDMMLVSYMLEE